MFRPQVSEGDGGRPRMKVVSGYFLRFFIVRAFFSILHRESMMINVCSSPLCLNANVSNMYEPRRLFLSLFLSVHVYLVRQIAFTL